MYETILFCFFKNFQYTLFCYIMSAFIRLYNVICHIPDSNAPFIRIICTAFVKRFS